MSPPGGTAGDLLALHGRFGAIHILSQKSKQKIFTLKMNNHVNAVAFSPDGSLLYSHGGKYRDNMQIFDQSLLARVFCFDILGALAHNTFHNPIFLPENLSLSSSFFASFLLEFVRSLGVFELL